MDMVVAQWSASRYSDSLSWNGALKSTAFDVFEKNKKQNKTGPERIFCNIPITI